MALVMVCAHRCALTAGSRSRSPIANDLFTLDCQRTRVCSTRHGDIWEVGMREKDTAINEPAHCHIDIARPSEYGNEGLSRDRNVE